MLPQVLAGLGLFSLLSAGCLFWLAVVSLVYQVWVVRRRPPFLRTWGIKTILAVSLVLNAMVIGGWIVISIRYR